MPALYTGSRGPIEQAPRRIWSRDKGWQTVRSWKGSIDACRGLIPALTDPANGAESVDLEEDAGIATISATFGSIQDGSQEEVTDLWELAGNDIQHDLFELPAIRDLDDTTMTNLRLARQAGEANDPGFGGEADAEAAFKLIQRGTEAFLTSQFVLRRIRTMSSRFDYSAIVTGAFVGLEEIWTTAQVQAAEPAPGILEATLDLIPAPAAVTGYLWGWLKKSPTITQIAGARFQITQEWWLEQWSTFIYAQHT